MKRAVSIILAAILILAIGTASAFAVSERRGANFVDADENGICDNYDGDRVCPQDGIGRGAGRGRGGCGSGFADADGDGICDNYDGGGACSRNGLGAQRGRGCRNRV